MRLLAQHRPATASCCSAPCPTPGTTPPGLPDTSFLLVVRVNNLGHNTAPPPPAGEHGLNQPEPTYKSTRMEGSSRSTVAACWPSGGPDELAGVQRQLLRPPWPSDLHCSRTRPRASIGDFLRLNLGFGLGREKRRGRRGSRHSGIVRVVGRLGGLGSCVEAEIETKTEGQNAKLHRQTSTIARTNGGPCT